LAIIGRQASGVFGTGKGAKDGKEEQDLARWHLEKAPVGMFKVHLFKGKTFH
jgi:hypothetical protein